MYIKSTDEELRRCCQRRRRSGVGGLLTKSIFRIAGLLGLGLLAASCTSTSNGAIPAGRESVALSAVTVSSNGRWLSFDIQSCGANPTASVDENDDEIAIFAQGDIQSSSDTEDCSDELWVELEKPLGERGIVDGLTGLPIDPGDSLMPAMDLEPDSIFGVWELTELAGEVPRSRPGDNRPPQISIGLVPWFGDEGGTEGSRLIGGNVGCNGFGGRYVVVDGRLRTTSSASTLMACGNGLNNLEWTLQKLFRDAAIEVQDWRLTLRGVDGTTASFRRGQRPSGIGSYRVESVDGEMVSLDASLDLGLERYVAFVGCHITGVIRPAGDGIVFEDAGPIPGLTATTPEPNSAGSAATSDSICDNPTQLESAIATGFLDGTAEADGYRLELTSSDGTIIVFRHG